MSEKDTFVPSELRTKATAAVDAAVEKDQLFCFAEHPKDKSQWSTIKKMKMREIVIG